MIQVVACSIYIVLSTCKLFDTLVGLTVDDRLGGLVVVDGPPVFPNFMNNGVSIIRESDFRYQHVVSMFCFQHASYLTH